ncbi:MAG: DUF6055 domain-containing protein [Bacteroidetes bacterium]|nr:DUF6055 domain-containing protein [Bacteroidota bacterium]
MKKFSLIFFLIPALSLFSQNLDSLYNDFLRIEGLPHYVKGQVVTSVGAPIKCRFGIISQVTLNYDRFKPDQQKFIISVLQRPTLDTSIVSPSGKFRIHFNKTGNDAPLYDPLDLAKAADSSYNFEVNILGFLPPPKDGNAGGDDRYDIYIVNETEKVYGGTTPDQLITDSTWTSYIDLDNDFAGSDYYTHGIDAARVTVAHELNHAIQVGNYIYRPTDTFYYELTSTSMEEFVYDSINDYYNYLGVYFSSPNKTFSSNDGYDLAIWNIFLKDRFGFGIIKRAWELMPAERALQAVAGSIQDAGSNFKVEFNTFGQWTYFTGSRSVPGKYFKEASNFPLIQPLMNTQFNRPTTTLNVSSEAVSNNFLVLNDASISPANTFVALISNCDISGGISFPVKNNSFTFTLSSQPFSEARKVLDGYYTKLDAVNSFVFSQSNIFNNIPIAEGQIISDNIDYAFPQPFNYNSQQTLFFPVFISSDGTAELYVYNINMKLVYSGQKRIVASDKVVVPWDGIDSDGKKLGSGVYIYITKSGDKIKKGKFVIYND